MVSLNDSCCSSSLVRKFKVGDTREDGHRFSQYQKRKNNLGQIIIYEQWLSPDVYDKERLARLVRDRERKRKHRENPEYRKKHNEYLKNQRKSPEFRKKDNKYRSEKNKTRRAADELFRLKCNMRCIIAQAFRLNGYKKKSKSEKILGCSWSFLKSYIEVRFQDGMSWENRSEWHIDHIIPHSKAKTKKDVIRLNHYKNLRPLWAKENLIKADNLIEEQLNLI
jgi:hypothetical protein